MLITWKKLSMKMCDKYRQALEQQFIQSNSPCR